MRGFISQYEQVISHCEQSATTFISDESMLCLVLTQIHSLIAIIADQLDVDRLTRIQQRMEKQKQFHQVLNVITQISEYLHEFEHNPIDEFWIDNLIKLITDLDGVNQMMHELGDTPSDVQKNSGVKPEMYNTSKRIIEFLHKNVMDIIKRNGHILLNFMVTTPPTIAPDTVHHDTFWVGEKITATHDDTGYYTDDDDHLEQSDDTPLDDEVGLTNPFIDGSRNILLTQNSPTATSLQNKTVRLIKYWVDHVQ